MCFGPGLKCNDQFFKQNANLEVNIKKVFSRMLLIALDYPFGKTKMQCYDEKTGNGFLPAR